MKINLEAQVKDLQDQVQELKDLVYAMAAVSGSGLSIHTEVHEGEKVGRLSDVMSVAMDVNGDARLCIKAFSDNIGTSRYQGDNLVQDGAHLVDEVGNVAPLMMSHITTSSDEEGFFGEWAW